MEAFLVTSLVVAVSEIGDKTQLLSLFLAARFRRPVPIILAIAVATLLNHGIAAALGTWLHASVSADTLRWLLGASFLAIAGWTLLPDQLDEQSAPTARYGVFVVTLIAFFLAEIGDKTQIATALLAARYNDLLLVVLGTTLGMMLANAPAVLFGHHLGERVPLAWVRRCAALLFGAQGVLVLLGYGVGLGTS